jgi:hypothetical protein
MGMDTWATAAILDRLSLIFAGRSGALKLALRVEAFEDEAAVVTEQLVHAHRAEKNTRIVKIPLNPLALAPWALHTGPFYNLSRGKMRR